MLESSDFVKDDTLKICCTVGVVVSTIQGPRLHYIHIAESNLGQQFGELLEDVENADVTFDVSGEKFHAHRVVLATGKWMKEATNEDIGGRIRQGRADSKIKRGSDLHIYLFYLPSRKSSISA